MVAADVYRPAAITQLQVLGQELDMPVYTEEGSKDLSPLLSTLFPMRPAIYAMSSSSIRPAVYISMKPSWTNSSTSRMKFIPMKSCSSSTP